MASGTQMFIQVDIVFRSQALSCDVPWEAMKRVEKHLGLHVSQTIGISFLDCLMTMAHGL
jgi:hypothetical protein